MKKFMLFVIVVCAASFCWGSEIIYQANSSRIANIMRAQGYSVSLDSEHDILWHHSDIKTFIIFKNGQNEETNFYYFCSFSVNADNQAKAIVLANDYNRRFKFGKSYVNAKDGKCNVIYQLTLNLNKGITRSRLIDYFDDCVQFTKTWKKEVVDKL